MSNVEQIIKSIGVRRLSEALLVGDSAIINARNRNIFPTRWRNIVVNLCIEEEIECDDTLFSFIQPPKKAPIKAKT